MDNTGEKVVLYYVCGPYRKGAKHNGTWTEVTRSYAWGLLRQGFTEHNRAPGERQYWNRDGMLLNAVYVR